MAILKIPEKAFYLPDAFIGVSMPKSWLYLALAE